MNKPSPKPRYYGLAGIGTAVLAIVLALLEMEGQFWAAIPSDVLFLVAIFLVYYGAIRAAAPFEWLLCGAIFFGIGVFYGFEPQTVLSGSGLGFGLDREGAGTVAIVLILLTTLFTAALSFRKANSSQV